MTSHYAMLAHYNRWANCAVHGAAAKLSDADYRADGGAFFGSVHGTLNHLLVTDRIWLHRMTQEGPTYPRLDLILHDDLASLRTAREAEDARIIGFVEGLGAEQLAASFSYTRVTSPEPVAQPLWAALVHLFNHETHHRGQVHALLTRFAGARAGPILDLIAFQRASGMGMA